MDAGCRMAIAKGKDLHPLKALEDGARATWFVPSAEPLTARKRWIAGVLAPVGTLAIDAGAAAALARGKSLLAGRRGGRSKGISAAATRWRWSTWKGGAVAKGLSAYSADDARRIAGHRTEEIEALLGWRGRTAVIHRDDLVLIERGAASPDEDGREAAQNPVNRSARIGYGPAPGG